MNPEESLSAEEVWKCIRAKLAEIVEREAAKDFPVSKTEEE